MKTGYLVRIRRDGEWQPVDITDLTDFELDDLARNQPNDGWKWAKTMVQWIRDNVAEERKG